MPKQTDEICPEECPPKYGQILFVLLLLVVLIHGCTSPEKQSEQEDMRRNEFVRQIYRNKNEDSLNLLLQQSLDRKNDFESMLCHKQLGLFLRENARFSEAIHHHQEGLAKALLLKDTLEIVQALNNLGTDFRRIGAQDEAVDYHYRALAYIEDYSQATTSQAGIKNRVVSLNGIGNVSLTLGYLDDAEKYFRIALQDETKLNSLIGQAINYANLGAVFELRQQLDSAHIYYNLSLDKNRAAKSDMGIGLSLIHIGKLYEKENDFGQAKKHYVQAYELMAQISDRWHWLESCISLARIYLIENNVAEFNRYISLAEKTAREINSPEHLSIVFALRHDFETAQGNYRAALQNYKLHKEIQDSVMGIQKSNRYTEIRVDYEQNRSSRLIGQMEAQNELIEQKRHFAMFITWGVIALSLIIIALLYYGYRQRTCSNKILRQMEQTRSDFFTNITHEFRTPLTVIKGFNRKLGESDNLTDNERHRYTDAIERQSDKLLSLVNQLLDVAKLKAGKDTPEWTRSDIVSYLRMTVDVFKLYAQGRKQELVFYSDMEEQEMDFIPFYIDRIVSNLLSNAIKHTGENGLIKLSVLKGGRPRTVVICVTDNGEGIAAEDFHRIFELFYQSPYAHNSSGNGIGLAFTKMMVEKMHGNITVESVVNQGTAFTITLPVENKRATVALSQNQQPALPKPGVMPLWDEFETVVGDDTTTEPPPVHAKKPTVLVVEDNKDVAFYIKNLINGSYNVLTAENGQLGWDLAQEHVPDLVITDVMMPVKDGCRLCCEMKQSLLLNHVPVIMLTAKSSDEDRIEGLRCGADAYIHKPFRPEELLIRIEKLLENRRVLKEKFHATVGRDNGSKMYDTAESDIFILKLNDLIHREKKKSELTPSFLAESLSMSSSQLSRKLNAVTGYSTSGYLLQMKVAHAKKLLLGTTQSMSEIAETCGFYDAAYFSRTFKKHTGMSPMQFRQQLLRHE